LPVFADRASCKSAKERIVTAEEVIRSEPDIIIDSWCGKKFRPERLRAAQSRIRPKVYFEEWDEPMISGIGVSELIEAAGGAILQPQADRTAAFCAVESPQPQGPTDGLAALQAIIANAP
jgi:hypothetical protein